MSNTTIKNIYEKIHNAQQPTNSTTTNNKIPNDLFTTEDYHSISDYITHKFAETAQIFSKFSYEDFYQFILISEYKDYKENELVMHKDTPCDKYMFILYGDMDFFEKDEISDSNMLIKTISAGKIYGHLVKEKYNYCLRARTKISIITVNKEKFDNLIKDINKVKNSNKFQFIKKFFPKIRLYSDDIINNILQFFDRVKYKQFSKILVKDDYNEYIYLIISGKIGYCRRPKSLFTPGINDDKEDFYENLLFENDYIVLEKLQRGDLIGINSALKRQKNFYTAITLEENTEVYRISKGNVLFYFGGSSGILPVALKSLGELQDMSAQLKIEYLKKLNIFEEDIVNNINNNFGLIFPEKKIMNNKYNQNFSIIDENSIKNNLFEAWKSLDNLKKEVSDLKNKLLGGPIKINKNSTTNDGEKTIKDFTQITGDATNRVVSRKLNMGLNTKQLKGLNKLNMFCGIKDSGEDNLKKVAGIASKNEGGGKNKLMSFIRNDDSVSTSLESYSEMKNKESKEQENKKMEKNNDNNLNEDKNKKDEEKKVEKPKFQRPKHSLRNLRGEI